MNSVFLGAVFSLLTSAPMAQALVYDCDIKSFSPQGFIPPRVVVSFSEGDDRAIVVDGYIMKYNKTPLSAELKIRGTNSYNLKWQLKDIPLTNENLRVLVLYSAVLHTARQTLSVSAILPGYDNGVMRGRGKCKILKDK